jgi:hypothetical protein
MGPICISERLVGTNADRLTINKDDVSLTNAFISQDSGEDFYFIKKLPIGEPLL